MLVSASRDRRLLAPVLAFLGVVLACGPAPALAAGDPGVATAHRIASPLATGAPRQWTVMLYLDGENRDIQNDLLTAFEAMIAADVGSDANVNVVAQFDRIPGSDRYGGWTEAHRFYVTPGMEPTPAGAITDWGDGQGGREVDMADGATLRDFVTWAAAYPAGRYALIVADHGYGWKGLCIDETSLGDSMPLKDLAAALEGLPFHLDYLGLDACLMQSAEVGYELRGCDVDVVVGSEAPATTWPLADVIAAITGDPGIASEALARQTCDLYFSAHPGAQDLTMSAYRLARMVPLAASVRALAGELATPTHDEVPERARDVIAELEQAVFYSRGEAAYPGANGLSIYFPDFEGPYHQNIPEEYFYFYESGVASFSLGAGWRGLLWRYYTRDPDLDPRLFRARDGVTMIEDTVDLHDLCARLASPPPTTIASGPDDAWHRVPVDVTFTATPAVGGLPVSYTEYRLDDGDWTRGASVTVPAGSDHSADGVHSIDYRSADTAVPPTVEKANHCSVKIDTTGPTTWAPRCAGTRRGGVVTLRYRVDDALSEKASITIHVKDSRGRTVRTLTGTRPTNTALQSRFLCLIPKGTYRFFVYARDLAGNRQTRVGGNRLIVKSPLFGDSTRTAARLWRYRSGPTNRGG